jgi:peptidoglycan/xylan/chitin deacetylase (PgdA/CDA1 family)
MSGQNALKRAARTAFHKCGGLRAARWMNRKGLRILMYHRFSEREALARQCAHIRQYYSPVSFSQVADWLQHDGTLPENALAVTVDDGYRDFYQVAYPVFRQYAIPAMVYLVSDFLDGRLWLWVDQIKHAFLQTQRQRITVDIPGESPRNFDLGTIEAREMAAREVTEALKKIPNAERLRFLEGIPELLGIQLPEKAPPEYEALQWNEVREMAAGGIEFGAHTRTHPILSRLVGERELAGEVGGSKRWIEEQVGLPVDHFCYPNGSEPDINREAVEAVRAANFRTAVTTAAGLNHSRADRLQLLRIGVQPDLEEQYFQRCAAAFWI